MPLTYEIDSRLTALTPVLDEHADWFGRIMRGLFYPENAGSTAAPVETFKRWLELSGRNNMVEAVTLENLRRLHNDMHLIAARLLQGAHANGKPDIAAFDMLVDIYGDFILQLRRLERDSMLADSGLDPITGLRSRKAMDKDLERELERRARLGKPFCLVLIRIDDYEALQGSLNEEQLQEIFEKISILIRCCIRSFDDAYRVGEGEFVMALKHTETVGATAAIARLRHSLHEEPIPVDRPGGLVTLSYCAAEPVPGDSIETLLENMRQDLNRYDTGGDTALEYLEQSPLQRFLKLDAEDEGV